MGLLKAKNIYEGDLRLVEADIMQNLPVDHAMDIVFSIGLIEHFSPIDSARVIQKHFALAKKGGLVIITFPTPTWLYRFARKISEALGLWIFHDERPLSMQSVLREMEKYGDRIDSFVNWKIVFTQGIVVVEAGIAGDDALAVTIGAVD
jgi:cyclopropane fatty-acyl-phospholipid synthase-like methyltransferase